MWHVKYYPRLPQWMIGRYGFAGRNWAICTGAGSVVYLYATEREALSRLAEHLEQ